MMTANYPNARDVTPANVRREQQAREVHLTKIRVVKSKIERIEKTISRLAKDPNTSNELLSKWRQSWDWHNKELQTLEGK
jgi:hypothetical protein